MTIKELKEILKDLSDDMIVKYDYMDFEGEVHIEKADEEIKEYLYLR